MAGSGRRTTDWYRVGELLLFVPASGLDHAGLAGCPSGQRERSVKPSRYATLVRIQHLPLQDHQPLTRIFTVDLAGKRLTFRSSGRGAVYTPPAAVLTYGSDQPKRSARIRLHPAGSGCLFPIRSRKNAIFNVAYATLVGSQDLTYQDQQALITPIAELIFVI
jgi:hypothetical protein